MKSYLKIIQRTGSEQVGEIFKLLRIFSILNPAKCYYLDKMEKYLDMECNDFAVINGKISNDMSLKTVLFESDFPNCILPKE